MCIGKHLDFCDEAIVWYLTELGFPQRVVAYYVNVDQSNVCRELKQLRSIGSYGVASWAAKFGEECEKGLDAILWDAYKFCYYIVEYSP